MSSLGRPVRTRTGHVGRVWSLGPTPGTWWCIFPLLDARPHLYRIHSGRIGEGAVMRLATRVTRCQPTHLGATTTPIAIDGGLFEMRAA